MAQAAHEASLIERAAKYVEAVAREETRCRSWVCDINPAVAVQPGFPVARSRVRPQRFLMPAIVVMFIAPLR